MLAYGIMNKAFFGISMRKDCWNYILFCAFVLPLILDIRKNNILIVILAANQCDSQFAFKMLYLASCSIDPESALYVVMVVYVVEWMPFDLKTDEEKWWSASIHSCEVVYSFFRLDFYWKIFNVF